MGNTYTWLKFVHVASIAGWFGGFAALAVLNGVARAQRDSGSLATYLRYGESLGPRLIGPASGLALLSGVLMMVVGHLGMPLWLIWGMSAAALFIFVGVVFLRPILGKLQAAAGSAAPDVDRLLARQRTLLLLNLLILASAAWAMVLKPT
jgi:uncharacterized membrane protein